MPETITSHEPHNRFTRFLRRLAEVQARALAGDQKSQLIVNEYGLARWCGVPPERALAQAESMVREAYGGEPA